MKEGMILRTFEVDKELYNEFKIICIKNNVIPSKFFRSCIVDYINKYTIYNNKDDEKFVRYIDDKKNK